MGLAPPPQLFAQQQANDTAYHALSALLRQQPWYIDQLRQWGADPNDPNLNLAQSQAAQLNTLAQQHGFDMSGVGAGGRINQQGQVESVAHTSTLHELLKAGLLVGGAATGGTLLAGLLGGGAAGAGSMGADAAGIGATQGLDAGGLASLGGAASWTPGLGSAGLLPSTTIGDGMMSTMPGGAPSGAVPSAFGAGAGATAGVAGTAGAAAAGKGLGGLLGLSGQGSGVVNALAALAGVLGGNALASNGAQANVPPQLNDLLNLGVQRAQAQTPTFNAVNSGILQMLPTFAKNSAGGTGGT